MKLDIVPTNEIELTDAELEAVFGGCHKNNGGGGNGGGGNGDGGCSYSYSQSIHSYALVCDVNVFSINLSVVSLLNIASPTQQVCVNHG